MLSCLCAAVPASSLHHGLQVCHCRSRLPHVYPLRRPLPCQLSLLPECLPVLREALHHRQWARCIRCHQCRPVVVVRGHLVLCRCGLMVYSSRQQLVLLCVLPGFMLPTFVRNISWRSVSVNYVTYQRANLQSRKSCSCLKCCDQCAL